MPTMSLLRQQERGTSGLSFDAAYRARPSRESQARPTRHSLFAHLAECLAAI
jgi:hypothetical protein